MASRKDNLPNTHLVVSTKGKGQMYLPDGRAEAMEGKLKQNQGSPDGLIIECTSLPAKGSSFFLPNRIGSLFWPRDGCVVPIIFSFPSGSFYCIYLFSSYVSSFLCLMSWSGKADVFIIYQTTGVACRLEGEGSTLPGLWAGCNYQMEKLGCYLLTGK